MHKPLIIVGAGGFARETLDVVFAMSDAGSLPIEGVVDDRPNDHALSELRRRNVNYLGTRHAWQRRAPESFGFVVAVGSPPIRAKLATEMTEAGHTPFTLIHPDTTVGTLTTFGGGTVVCAGARVSTNVSTGAHVHLNPGIIIGHDTRLGLCVSVNPGAVLSGGVAIGDRVLIGAGAVVLQNLSVGDDAVVGAAACVTRSVEAGSTVVGVPAR